MVEIIIGWKNKKKLKPVRSEIERELRQSGWGASLTDEQLDKTKFIERKWKEKYGAEGFVRQDQADKVR
jgi:hypothetical protein